MAYVPVLHAHVHHARLLQSVLVIDVELSYLKLHVTWRALHYLISILTGRTFVHHQTGLLLLLQSILLM